MAWFFSAFVMFFSVSSSFAAGFSGNWAGQVTYENSDGQTATVDTIGVSLNATYDALEFTQDLSRWGSSSLTLKFDIEWDEIYYNGARVGSISDTEIDLSGLHIDEQMFTYDATMILNDDGTLSFHDHTSYDEDSSWDGLSGNLEVSEAKRRLR